MPTESLYRLLVEGHAPDLLAFQRDEELWNHEPWFSMYGVLLEESEGQLSYRYNDDYKRPAPVCEGMAAAHPSLRLTLEWCDEFATVGGRAIYVEGRKLSSQCVDPLSLHWVEWEWEE